MIGRRSRWSNTLVFSFIPVFFFPCCYNARRCAGLQKKKIGKSYPLGYFSFFLEGGGGGADSFSPQKFLFCPPQLTFAGGVRYVVRSPHDSISRNEYTPCLVYPYCTCADNRAVNSHRPRQSRWENVFKKKETKIKKNEIFPEKERKIKKSLLSL